MSSRNNRLGRPILAHRRRTEKVRGYKVKVALRKAVKP